ncbi:MULTISPECIES: TolC family outer membrane protein [Variovorax]|uniref:TolC family outer membrane protein n=1 Tax=Variovorax TaxID=34072 RepID=UPI000899F32F|nr:MULTISPECIES: TolC family outer membrane protein [unclassified Variovorax]SDZ01490.1 outer membrane protein/outer membrane protein, protease secretion system [Variovorax sp. YR634]SEU13290.1 outer membrane protein/outer membrane protein, protease secretion system [Variovorax sp. OV084]SOD25786.1 outer membrane protein, protease secretion system [Variovorax sp. YR752]
MKKTALAFAAAGLLWGPAWSLDLSQAYGEALEQDSTIRSVRAATDARRERLPQARAQLLPNLSASVSRYRNWLERTSPDASGHLVTSNLRYTSSSEVLSLRQPIFRMYQMADYRQARAQVDDAEAILERELQNVGVRVSGAYFEALLAEEHLALVLSQKTAYTTQLDAAQKRLGAGFGTRTDIDEARAALDLNVAQELEARQNLDFTRRQLQSLVNRPIDGLASLDPSRMRLVRPAPDRVEDWIERAELNSPELRSLGAQVEAARHELEKAQAGHYPTLDAIAQWSRNDSDTITSIKTRYNNRSIGLQLNIPLYSGGHVSSTVRQALADQQRAEEALEALRRDLGVRLHREFRGVTEGILRVKALEQAVRSAEQVVISNRRSFEAGSRTLPDVLNSEHQKVSAQRDLAQARFVYLMSRIRLQALSGGAKAEVIDEINGWLTR